MSMNIAELAYELYKEDWKIANGITREQEKREMIRFYKDPDVKDCYDSYEDYIWDYGYGGQLYVCFNEFLRIEYRSKEYIEALLGDEELIKEYRKDLEKGGIKNGAA